eukprot:4001593-Prymnesium_polylepis.1
MLRLQHPSQALDGGRCHAHRGGHVGVDRIPTAVRWPKHRNEDWAADRCHAGAFAGAFATHA